MHVYVRDRSAFAKTGQSGFSLLEILIAVLVLSIGILGMSGLQLSSLRNNQQSYQRSQATALVSGLMDRMRANRAQAAQGSYTLAVNTTPTAPTVNCESANCTPAQLATYDLSSWYTTLNQTLTGATARITCSTSPCTLGVTQTITVLWDEGRTGATNTSCPGPSTFNAAVHLSCFSVSFAP